VTDAAAATPDTTRAEDAVVELCRDLIRLDTSNYGDGSGPGERAAAEYVAERLSNAGLEPKVIESEKGRASVVARWAGSDRTRDALVVHGHLDVVPASAADWQVDPFAAEVRDGCIWGRGAVDMKDMDAMMLATVEDWVRRGERPPRDVVLAFFADEEAGGLLGAHWLVDRHRDVFEGATEAISEVGGFSLTLEGQRFYLMETAQKGLAWLKLTAAGRAGHGSMVNDDNAVTALCEAVARIGTHRWPIRMTKTVRAFLDGVEETLGVEFDPADPDALISRLGSASRLIGATLSNTTNPTILQAGYKTNVIPQSATAFIDGRTLPGYEDELIATVRELAGPKVLVEFDVEQPPLEVDPSGALYDAMVASVLAEDPEARALPYCLSGGTDNKPLAKLGIKGYGFAPLRLPADLDFAGMFHGVDERVPVDSLKFGVRVLDRFLRMC
jgi:acetylornithine deacetylase/succinyl-diaminopimelate desuccinylase-like protein